MNTGYKSVVFDNFSNSLTKTLGRRQTVTGKGLHVVQGDIRNQAVRENKIRRFDCQLGGCFFAGLREVGESVENMLDCHNSKAIRTHRLMLAIGKVSI